MILPKLFAVVQMDEAKAWCHGSCGRALAVPFELVPRVPAVACKSGDCPHRAEDMECGHVWKPGERRHEYDHHLGYAASGARRIKRPGQNANRPRDPSTGKFLSSRSAA